MFRIIIESFFSYHYYDLMDNSDIKFLNKYLLKMRLIWCGLSFHSLAFIAAVFFLAETGGDGGVMQWKGIPGAELKPLDGMFTQLIWIFSILSISLGLYFHGRFREQRLQTTFANYKECFSQTVRHQIFALQIINTASIGSLIYVLLGGSIWHFVGVNLVTLISMMPIFPKIENLSFSVKFKDPQ